MSAVVRLVFVRLLSYIMYRLTEYLKLEVTHEAILLLKGTKSEIESKAKDLSGIFGLLTMAFSR